MPKDKSTYPLKWYDPILLATLPHFAAFLIKALNSSCKLVGIYGQAEAEEAMARAGGKAVYVTWHQRIIYLARFLDAPRVTLMISQSRDGEYGTALAKRFGAKAVRGSSTRGGAEALKELIQCVQGGAKAGMIADGPLGPPRKAKVGAVIIAKETQAPLIPVMWSAERCWCLNSWDRHLIPKPFSKVVARYSPPIWIPFDADSDHVEQVRSQLEASLNRAAQWCDEFLGARWPWNKEKSD